MFEKKCATHTKISLKYCKNIHKCRRFRGMYKEVNKLGYLGPQKYTEYNIQ